MILLDIIVLILSGTTGIFMILVGYRRGYKYGYRKGSDAARFDFLIESTTKEFEKRQKRKEAIKQAKHLRVLK